MHSLQISYVSSSSCSAPTGPFKISSSLFLRFLFFLRALAAQPASTFFCSSRFLSSFDSCSLFLSCGSSGPKIDQRGFSSSSSLLSSYLQPSPLLSISFFFFRRQNLGQEKLLQQKKSPTRPQKLRMSATRSMPKSSSPRSFSSSLSEKLSSSCNKS